MAILVRISQRVRDEETGISFTIQIDLSNGNKGWEAYVVETEVASFAEDDHTALDRAVASVKSSINGWIKPVFGLTDWLEDHSIPYAYE